MMTSPLPSRPQRSVFELRQYTLVPQTRDAFVILFDDELVDTQEDAGIRVVGQFRDVGRPDLFVWLRAFVDMGQRRRSLEAFYTGPVWAEHRNRANAMMTDSDNVLLLRAALPGLDVDSHLGRRPPIGSTVPEGSVVRAVVHTLTAGSLADAGAAYGASLQPLLARHGGDPFAVLRTEPAPNDFPQLPVREESVVVTLARFDDEPAADRHQSRLEADPQWVELVESGLGPFAAHPQVMHLAPTPRSVLA